MVVRKQMQIQLKDYHKNETLMCTVLYRLWATLTEIKPSIDGKQQDFKYLTKNQQFACNENYVSTISRFKTQWIIS
jgi:hypothetical protein